MESLSLNKLTAAVLLALSAGTLTLLIGMDAHAVDSKAAAEAKPAEIISSGSKGAADTDFKKLDGNNDASISAKEATKDKNLSAIFDAVDANHDGGISAEEYASFKSALSNTKTLEGSPAAN